MIFYLSFIIIVHRKIIQENGMTVFEQKNKLSIRIDTGKRYLSHSENTKIDLIL